MYAAQGLLLRASIVLGMVAAVVTILYLTPMPDQYFLSCDRPCHDLDWPMICRVKLSLENYHTVPHCSTNNCTIADGTPRAIFAVNRELPGPSIQICQNDILVVDVINKIPGHSVAIHWRGQPQNEAPTMDGAPMVTQCPISSYTTFQYRFRASSPGTHLWHAHAGAEVADGIFGALIVRQPQKVEPHRKLYDVDDKNHVIIISEWGGELSSDLMGARDAPRSLLINGKGPDENVFRVREGRRYRFRTAYSGGPMGCPVSISIDQHLLKVIALDGNPITPYEVSSATLSKGERLDFVLKANQAGESFVLRVSSECGGPMDGRALVKYDAASGERKLGESRRRADLVHAGLSGNTRKFDTSFCESKLGQVCILDVHSLTKMPQSLAADEVDTRIYLGFDHKDLGESLGSASKQFGGKVYRMNNLTFTYPSSPLLTQREDVPRTNICNSLNKPENCRHSEICECVHVEEIPLGATVELIFADQGVGSEETIFHLHGYSFYVVGFKQFSKPVTSEEARKLDGEGRLMKRNFNSPAVKDTIRVPKFGVAAVRFIANNPGYWMIRDENSKQWSRGLDVVLQVGGSCDMVAKPSNFPTCGSWVGPDFFLA